MYIKSKMQTLVLLSGLLAAGNALAAGLSGGVVYEKVDIFKDAVNFTDGFMIDAAGTYQATLTDFKFPNAFKESGLNVTTSTASLGKLLGPGAFTFEAGPGNYYVSMFAQVGHSPLWVGEKQRLLDEKRNQQRERWRSLTQEERDASTALWRSRTEEERNARLQRQEDRKEKWVEAQLTSMNLGQYGIQIALLDGETAATLPQAAQVGATTVPLPAAFWLFGSGLLGLAGLARRTAGRS